MTGWPGQAAALLPVGARMHGEIASAAYFFRISYALKVKPELLTRRFEAIQGPYLRDSSSLRTRVPILV